MELINIQEELAAQIEKLKTNFKKSPKERITPTFINTRLQNLDAKFKDFTKNHYEAVKKKSSLKTNYFEDDVFSVIEEFYMEFKTELMELLASFTEKDTQGKATDSGSGNSKASVKLPKIIIPKFSGDYTEWISFRDLFTSLIHKSKDIDYVQKLQYLKGYLTGEAEQLLRHIPISNNSYEQCWTMLNHRYNNKQYLVNCILQRFFNLKPISVESASCIKIFLDSINDMMNGLSILDVSTKSWDVLIIYVISQKLDIESRKNWEVKVSSITNNSEVLPTITDFQDFLETRYHSLEFLDGRINKSKGTNSNSGHVNLHVSSSQQHRQFSCAYCDSAQHKIMYCKQFKDITVNDKRNFVQKKGLCFNCLSSSHVAKHCRSTTSCQICKRRHHTILHQSVTDSAVEEATADIGGKGDIIKEEEGIDVEGSYFSNGLGRESLIGTALVNAETKSGKGSITLRALIDPGSHVSFITEAAAQLLGLSRKTVRENFAGLGGKPTLTAKSMTEVTLRSSLNQDCRVRMKEVFILEKLTALLPPREVNLQSWPFLDHIKLADPDFHRPSKIDILIGTDGYGHILRDGVKRCPSGSLVAQETIFGWILSGKYETQCCSKNNANRSVCMKVQMDDLLKSFWEMDNERSVTKRMFSEDDQLCEQFYAMSTKRDANGRYVVKLPYKESGRCSCLEETQAFVHVATLGGYNDDDGMCCGVGSSGVSVSTQADIAHSAKGYESEDENAGRKWPSVSDERPASKTTMYSKQEFREQYCINNKQLDLLELEKSKKDRFLGCLSQYHIESPCSRANRASFLSVCVRRRVPSDENLNADYAPIQRYPRFGQPTPAPPELCAYDADLECSYFRRRPRSVCSQPDPKRYTWMPEDEDFTRMEWPQSVIEDNAGWPHNYNVDQIASVSRGGSLPRPPSIIPCPAHTPIPPPPPPPPLTIPPHRTKHVSFARSHTLTTFDDSVMPAAVGGSRFRRDCERLIDGRVVKPEAKPYSTLPVMFQPFPPYPQFIAQGAPAPIHYPPPIATMPSHPAPPMPRPPPTEQPKVVLLDSIKKGVMRTQATQTEACLGRKPHPPNYLSLSPRTIKRVKMVAAGVQTNGNTAGARRLTKSFSEVGGDRLAGRDNENDVVTIVESFINNDHEKLHRTQSEEPPRSPRSPTPMMPTSPVHMGDSEEENVTSSSVKSVASSSQIDKSSELSASQRQVQEYFQQNFQFIHESDRDDTVDDDIETIEKSMALNRRNLEFLQQEIAKQAKNEKSLRSILSKSTSDASQKTVNSSHPFSKTSTFQSEPSTETSATTTDDSEKNEKEIIIDFEPRPDDEAIPFTTFRRKTRRMLQKTLSEGEILLDVRKAELQTTEVKDAPIIMSTSQENMTREDREREGMYKQYIGQNYTHTPIKDEGIFGFEPDGSYSSSDGNAPYEDFHEKYISYKHEPFRNRSVSFEEQTEIIVAKEDIPKNSTAKSSPGSPEPVTIDVEVDQKIKRPVTTNNVAATLTPLEKISPSASNESLAVDPTRDHSDGMWNESQTTVLQVDSGTENGTVISSSDLSSLAASPGALALLTPTSRRKQLLLLQHQQRSSLDTDALDEEFDASQSQSPTSPRNKLDTSSSSSQQARSSLSPPAVVPSISLPITKQPTTTKALSPIRPPKMNHTPAIAITHPSLDLADVPFKRTPSFINKKRERALSPSRRRDLQRKAQQKEPNGTIPNQIMIMESPPEPILAKAASSETSLARTDSGKINTTDVSESTTTTEDYVTANSDSSKKSSSKLPNQNPENNKTQEGSSFESASSLYSSTRTENIAEDMVLPSFSPPLEINDDFIVPDLSSPPLPLPDRIPRPTVEKIEVKAEINPHVEQTKREKTEIKHKDDVKKVTKTMRGTISGKSSSSGSYSIGGSNPNVTETVESKMPAEKIVELPETCDIKEKEEKPPVSIHEKEQLVPKMMGSLSDDERSVHYSSSGYYESPVDDDDDGGLTYKHSQKYRSSSARPKSWVSDEKRRKKKAFMLEFSKSYDDSVSTSQDDWGKKSKDTDNVNQRSTRSIFKSSNKSPLDEKAPDCRKKKTHFVEKVKSIQTSPREPIDVEKSIKEKTSKEKDVDTKRPVERERYVKRTKLKPKSPTQSKNIDGSYRQHYERREATGTNMKLHLNIPTSDDSSEQYRKEGTSNGNISPRKHRRLRDSPRRKTGANSNTAKSPTSTNNHAVYRPRRKSGSNESISLPGSLPRRKQSIPTVPCLSSLEAEDIETTRTLTRAGSRLTPLRYVKSPTTSPRHNRKQDRDSKFAKAASAESLRSVSPGSDSVFYSEQTEQSIAEADGEAKAHCLHCGKEVHIVTATHEHDSVASRTSHTDESYADATPDIVPAPAGFADSPSCASSKKHTSGARLYKKLDKRYRSEDKSRHYRHRQDVRAKSEERGKEEYASCEKPQDSRIARSAGNSLDKLGGSSASVDPDEHEECSGSSEGAESGRDEKGIYATPWWCGNWILLSENDDQWTRIPPDVLITTDMGKDDPTESETEFNKKYAALTHRLVHRRACIELNRRQNDNTFESDKTVVVRRGNEEFGFRIHGSKPVVVSAIEPDTPAETSGLEVGDIVIAVNGINVLDKTHSEVVKIAHSGSEILELEVARTCEVVASLAHEGGPAALYSGYLWRAAPLKPHHPPRWTRRWFVLKRDNCLYYYKTDSSTHPVGALMLVNYQLSEEDAGRPNGFRLQRGGGTKLQLAADTAEAAARWSAVLAHAIDASNQRDGWLEVTMRNMKLPPSSIPRPDCFGYLMKLGSKWKSWAKRYCVLKDACLYFYNDGNSKNAFGMACLHGYRIQTCAPGGKKYAFEVMPTEPKQRHFYFHTESEMDRKRWMAALEYSIDRWMKAG